MKIIIDRQKVNARAQAANLASVGGLVVLLASVVVPLFLPDLAKFSFVMFVIGMGAAMIGIYFANRWVRKPRPEESLDKALKSLAEQYHLYHYPALPCEHLLLTPFGLIAFEVVNLNGNFSYRNGRWQEAMTIGRALRYIVEERVGDPVGTAQATVAELQGRLQKEFGAGLSVPIKALTVFTHPGVLLEIEEPNIPACRIEKLRKQVSVSGPRLDPDTYEKLSSFLERVTLPR